MPEPASLIGQTVSPYRIVVSEREKLYITSHYADYVTRNAEASRSGLSEARAALAVS
jgi:hypothetical protein